MDDEQQLLREKARLLEADRKAYFETSQTSLRDNKEVIKTLRKENKELKSIIAAAKRGPGAVQEKESSHLDHAIYSATLKLDNLRAVEQERRSALRKQHEVVGDIEINSQPILTEESFLTRKIRMLENRLDKSLIKYNEAISIKKTYEQIVKRLKEERVGFDNQLAAIERTLKAKDYDYQELLKMSHAANHAKEMAKRDLQQFKMNFDEERHQKDRELNDRKAYVQSKVDQTQKLERREKMLKQQEVDEQRAKAEDEQRQQQNQLALQSGGVRGGDRSADDDEKLSQYEAAFRAIKEATGVTDVKELMNRFIAQEETHSNLCAMSKEAQGRIEQLKAENAELGGKLEELRYSGSGQLGSRRIIEEFEIHLAEAANSTKSNSERFEHHAKLLINVKAGIEHLVEKLSSFRPDTAVPTMSDDNALAIFKVCETKLNFLSEEVNPSDLGGEEGQLTLFSDPPKYNRRVKLPREEEDNDDEDDQGPGDDADDDAVLKREQVKKISENSITRETKKLRRRKKFV